MAEEYSLTIPAGTILVRAGNTSNNRAGAPWKYFSYWRLDTDVAAEDGDYEVLIPSSAEQNASLKKNFVKNFDAFSSRISPEREGEFEFWITKKDASLLYLPYTALTFDTDNPYVEKLAKYLMGEIDKLGEN
jgi:hypothetical protein